MSLGAKHPTQRMSLFPSQHSCRSQQEAEERSPASVVELPCLRVDLQAQGFSVWESRVFPDELLGCREPRRFAPEVHAATPGGKSVCRLYGAPILTHARIESRHLSWSYSSTQAARLPR